MNEEPFQFSSWVRSDRTVEAEAVLLRDNVEVGQRQQTFQAGSHAIDVPGSGRSSRRRSLSAGVDALRTTSTPENNAEGERRAHGRHPEGDYDHDSGLIHRQTTSVEL